MDQQLLARLEHWHEENKYQLIIDTIESLPQEQITPELVSQLARAYNNLGTVGEYGLFQKAADLLLSVREELEETNHNWNYRLGFSYYYLDREDLALPFFEKALELLPGDADTLELIQKCQESLALPVQIASFAARTARCWQDFLAGEGELRNAIDGGDSEAIVEKCNSLLSTAFREVSFELGYSTQKQKYELILTPEGMRSTLFKLVYFASQAPAEVQQHWNILVGRQKNQGFGLRMAGEEVTAEDVQVLATFMENRVALTLCCEKLGHLLQANEGVVYNILSILCDQALGELAAIRYIDGFEVVATPPAGSILLSQLDALLQKHFGQKYLELTPEKVCEWYTGYSLNPPANREERYLREDCYVGITTLTPLVGEYLSGEEGIMNEYHADGAVPGFFFMDFEGIAKEDLLERRDQAQQALEAAIGSDITFIGGASGGDYSYLDFIAWDLRKVLDAAVEVFQNLPYPAVGFHSFRRDVDGVILKRGE